MEVTINGSIAKGSISAPPSKSLAHRYIICAALSEGKSTVTNIDFSEDILATIDCARELGAKVDIDGSTLHITGIKKDELKDSFEFKCRESGSTMRFFMAFAFLFGKKAKFYGSETLRKRPFSVYEDICRANNISFERKEDCIEIEGSLKPGSFEVPGNISSQFITGLLFILPLLNGNSILKLIPPIESRSYIDLTLQALNAFSIDASWDSDCWISIKGNQKYIGNEIEVEGDYSNAAFLDAFNYLGGCVNVLGLNKNSLQGDRVYKEYFEALKKEGAVLNISDCPDLGPVLFAVAAANNGGVFTGTKRLKIKESDRGSVMCEELSKLGVKTLKEEDKITIYKSEIKKPSAVLCGHNDHRIVMSLSLLLSKLGGKINEAEAVRKSFPDFFERIKSLGIEVE